MASNPCSRRSARRSQGRARGAEAEELVHFERPRKPEHGDYRLQRRAAARASALKRNPRELAQRLLEAAASACSRRGLVERRDRRRRASSTSASRPCAQSRRSSHGCSSRARATAAATAAQPQKVQVEFVSANPTGPAARRPRPPGGARRRDRGAARGAGPRGDARVLLQRRRRADREPRALGAGARARHHARATPGWPEDGYHGEYIEDIARDYRRGTAATSERPRGDPQVRGRLPAQGAGRRPAGLRREVRRLLPRVEPLHRRQGRRGGEGAGRERQDLREGRRAVAAHHRLRRRQGPRGAQVRRQLHLLRARRRLPRHQVAARLPQGDQRAGHRPPQHHDARARRPAGARPRHSRRATPTTCCTAW